MRLFGLLYAMYGFYGTRVSYTDSEHVDRDSIICGDDNNDDAAAEDESTECLAEKCRIYALSALRRTLELGNCDERLDKQGDNVNRDMYAFAYGDNDTFYAVTASEAARGARYCFNLRMTRVCYEIYQQFEVYCVAFSIQEEHENDVTITRSAQFRAHVRRSNISYQYS